MKCNCGHDKELHRPDCEGFDLTKPKGERVNHLCRCEKFVELNPRDTSVSSDLYVNCEGRTSLGART